MQDPIKFSLTRPVEYSEEIKKSRFTVKATPIETVDEAMAFLDSVREPPANHNCWAYRVGANYRFSDDGEPSGTAGKPIYNAIERLNLDNLLVVVVRYFGGIKLGAGGLIRAYGGTAARCLQQAEKQPLIARFPVQLLVPFEELGRIYPLLDLYRADKLSEQYTDNGVVLELSVPEPQIKDFRQAVADAGRGRINFHINR